MILSDGYDSAPSEELGQAMALLARRGCRILWLNPLKGWRDYAPVASGMAAALPYLDLFGPFKHTVIYNADTMFLTLMV